MFNMIEKKEKKSSMRSCLEALCDGKILKILIFLRGFMFANLRHMRSFEKIKSLRIGEITRLFTGTGKSCSSCDFLT